MRLTRRTLLAVSLQMALTGRIGAAADEQLEYHQGYLRWSRGEARAAAGRAGVTDHKREGDGATPTGLYPLVSAFYRADRIALPKSGLPLKALTPTDAWVDDPGDGNYNHLVSLPYPAHAEPMWIDDPVYDLLVVIGYNMRPVVDGAGSAIFLHIARSDFSRTAGCIAVEKSVLLGLMPRLGLTSKISIRA
jgi:L,D-peptidoglycan transpeptidase YkuD (ErfK/YbiS/YcfS/YnhG family)